MSDVREEAQRQLEAVRRDFEARLGTMVEEIAQAWEMTKTASDRPAQMSKVLELAHRLAGNAGFFGLTGVSRAASELEQALECVIARPSGDQVHDIDLLVVRLRMSSVVSRSA